MIKKLFCVALLSLAALSLFSCKDDEVVEDKFLHVYDSAGAELTAEGISFDNAEGTAKLRVLANADWELIVPSEVSWLTITPQTASAECDITVSVRENLSTDERSAKVDVMFGGGKLTDFEVKQDGAVPQLDITASATTVVAKGGDVTFDIVANLAWNYTVTPAEGVTEVSKTAGKLVLRFAETTDIDPKNFDVVFTGKSVEKTVTIKQNGNNPTLDVVASAQTIYWVGADVTFDIDANVPWTYTVAPATVTEVSKANDKLVLGFAEISATEAQNFTVTFTYGAGKTKTVAIKQNGKFKRSSIVADMLDIEFYADGTAKDVSPMNLTVKNVLDDTHAKHETYFSETYNRYVSKFKNTIGSNISNAKGFYDIDYTDNQTFIDKLSDGCTLETVVMLADDSKVGTAELKWFASTEQGGIGFLIPKTANDPNTSITFLPNVSETGSSVWRWACSGVKPEVGVYYHVVGVWNKEEGKAYVYINGELKGEADAPGNLRLAKAGATRFLVGGDPATTATTLQAAWNGDVPVARIYDKPLTAAEVAELYSVMK